MTHPLLIPVYLLPGPLPVGAPLVDVDTDSLRLAVAAKLRGAHLEVNRG